MIKLNHILEELMIEALPSVPIPQPSAIQIQHQEFSPDFVKYMRTVENSIGAGFDKQKQKKAFKVMIGGGLANRAR